MIGIGITTHNRKHLQLTVDRVRKYTPNAKIVVVDDASDNKVTSNFRFEHNVGVAKAKNKCLELLEDCEYIFLFDDDTYPIKLGWEQEYINEYKRTENEHFCFTFDHLKGGAKNGNIRQGIIKGLPYFNNPCGCMMFITKQVLNEVGGMSSLYKRYGYEHLGWSNRIHNAGLTIRPYIDINNSLQYFYSADYERVTESSVGQINKHKHFAENKDVCDKEKRESNWKPYKTINIVIGAYFNDLPNPQNNKVSFQGVQKWVQSVTKLGYHAILLTNRIEIDNSELFKNIWVDTNKVKSVYHNRFNKIIDWIIENEYYLNEVWITDTTDVEMLNKPIVKDKIYVGSEQETNNCKWILEKSIEVKKKVTDYEKVVKPESQLLNCGVIGGNVNKLIPILIEYKDLLNKISEPCADMPLINYLGYKHGFEFGEHVTTRFKINEYTNAWFKHK
jgi:hypothetical protein